MSMLVVPKCHRQGIVALPILAGTLAGVVSSFDLAWARQRGNPDWLYGALLFGPAVAAIAATAVLSRTGWRAFATGAMFAVPHFLTVEVLDIVRDPNGVLAALLLKRWTALATLAACAVFTLAVGMLAVGSRWLRAQLLYACVEQDGTRCWRCGYQPGSESILVCPECGMAKGQGQRLARVFGSFDAVKRRAKPALIIVLVAAAGIIAVWVMQPRTRRLLAFYRRFDEPLGGHVDGNGISVPCGGSWQGIDGRLGLGLWISYLPVDQPGVPAMELRLATMTSGSMGDAVNPVAPEVSCALDRAQAEWVVAHGVPQALIQSLRAAPAGGPATKGPTRIPAAEFFPEKPAASGR